MKPAPRVSVVIRTHNRAHLLPETLMSVEKQTYQDFELILVDDASKDNTKQVAEMHARPDRLRYFYKSTPGRVEALNMGIRMARGEYVALLDDDDLWLQEKLERQVWFLDSHPDAGLVHTFTDAIDKEGNLLPKETKIRIKLYQRAMRMGYTYEAMSWQCIIFPTSMMIRRECLDKVGLFDPNTEIIEDWDFALRVSLHFKIGTMPEVLARYRIHGSHSTSGGFVRGRTQAAHKHLALLESLTDCPFREKARYHLHMQLANAYYMAGDFENFLNFALKALRFNPFSFFYWGVGVHLLAALFPGPLLQRLKDWKQNTNKVSAKESSV